MDEATWLRHAENRRHLLARRELLLARWAAEDAAIAEARKRQTARFDQGLIDLDAVATAAAPKASFFIPPREWPT
jgi:hypothetical protein